MPIKNINMEWDHEDPNQAIPAHEAPPKTVETNIDEIERVRDIEHEAAPKRGELGESECIEMSPTQK